MRKAEDIYYGVKNEISNMSQGEIDIVCQSILDAPGDVALVIYYAKAEGWWNQDTEATCQSILDAPGDVAWIIYAAKEDGWWNQNNEDTCRSILEAPGDRALVIYCAKRDGWWFQNDEDTCRSILEAPGDRAWIIYRAKEEGWWSQDNEATCRSILESPGDRAWVIYSARRDGWWFQNDEDTCRSILEAPGNVASVIYKVKNDGWWIEPKQHSEENDVIEIIPAKTAMETLKKSSEERIRNFNELVDETLNERIMGSKFVIYLPYVTFGNRKTDIQFIEDAGYIVQPDDRCNRWEVELETNNRPQDEIDLNPGTDKI